MELKKKFLGVLILIGIVVATVYRFFVGITPVWLDISVTIFFLIVIAIGLCIPKNKSGGKGSDAQ